MQESVLELKNCPQLSKRAEAILCGANAAQKKAISHTSGPMLVLAGPGSGKTFAITKRIQYLTEVVGIPSSDILVITFTKAAAVSMKQRYRKLLLESKHISDGDVSFGTFHSIFFSILKKHTNYSSSDIVTLSLQREFMKHILIDKKMETACSNELADQYLGEVSKWKNLGITDEKIAILGNAYDCFMRQEHKIDFDDMLLMCKNLLSEKEIRSYWQERFAYILVDEFQDINELQYQILHILTEMRQNIFVVGDDDQAIYGFRGSNPEIMKRFTTDYENCEKVLLLQNYRCDEEIVHYALCCIRNNKNRFAKEIESMTGRLGKVQILGFETREKEIEYLHQRYTSNPPNTTLAFLFRTNYQREQCCGHLFSEEQEESWEQFCTREYVRDIMAILRFTFCGHKREDFLNFMNRPMRYIKRDYLDQETVSMGKLLSCYSENSLVYSNIVKLDRDIRKLNKMDALQAVLYILNGMEYEKYWKQACMQNATELAKMKDMKEKMIHRAHEKREIASFLQDCSAKAENMRKENRRAEFLTYHGAKGLEYDHVVLPGVNEGEVPRGKLMSQNEKEEERRMFYVAMTRARCSLTITYVNPSCFIDELLN